MGRSDLYFVLGENGKGVYSRGKLEGYHRGMSGHYHTPGTINAVQDMGTSKRYRLMWF